MNDEEILLSIGADVTRLTKALLKVDKSANRLANSITKSMQQSFDAQVKIANEANQKIAKSTLSARQIIKSKELEIETLKQKRLLELARIRVSKSLSDDKIRVSSAISSDRAEIISTRNKYKIQISEAKKANKELGALGAGGTGGNTSFGHKVFTTGSYAAAGAIIYNIANAFKEATKASIQFDTSIYKMTAILGDANKTFQENKRISEEATSALHAYSTVIGGTFREIDEAALTLGRAGIAMGEVVEATKVTAELAMITGDSLEDASKVVSSFTLAYGLASNEIRELGNQLTYAANASKLSIEDLGTMANYAIAGASAIGMTKEEVLGMATALSNMGVNASTIGTQIRKFGKLLRDDSKANTIFFDKLGMSQKAMLKAMQSDSKETLGILISEIQGMSQDAYEEATGGLEILTKQFTDSLRLVGDDALKHIYNIQQGADNLAKLSKEASMSIEKTWEKARNLFLWTQQDVATSMFDSMFDRTSIEAYQKDMDSLREGMFGVVAVSKIAAAEIKIAWNVVQLTFDGLILNVQQLLLSFAQLMNAASFGEFGKEVEYWNKAIAESGKDIKTNANDVSDAIKTMAIGYDGHVKAMEDRYQKSLKSKKVQDKAVKSEKELADAMNTANDNLKARLTYDAATVKYLADKKQLEAEINGHKLTNKDLHRETNKILNIEMILAESIADIDQRTTAIRRITLDILKEKLRYKNEESKITQDIANAEARLDKALLDGKNQQQILDAQELSTAKELLAIKKQIKIEALESKLGELDAKEDAVWQKGGDNKSELTNIEAEIEETTNKLILERHGLKQTNLDIDKEAAKFQIEHKERMLEYEAELRALKSESYEMELDATDRLLDSMDNLSESMSEGLNKFTKGLAKVGKAITAQGKNEAKQKKDIARAEAKYTKEKLKIEKKYNGVVGKEAEKKAEFTEAEKVKDSEIASAKQDSLSNQIDMYSAIAGGMQSMFEEGSSGAKAMMQVQQALAIVQAGVAIASAGAGDPYTAIPRVIAMAALMAQFVQGFGGGGGGGGPTAMEVRKEAYDSETELITNRLDRQIELLESIDKQGTAGVYKLDLAKTTYERTVGSMTFDIAGINGVADRVESVIKASYKYIFDEFESQSNLTLTRRYANSDRIDMNLAQLAENTTETARFLQVLQAGWESGNIDFAQYNASAALSKENVDKWIDDFQSAISEYALSMIDIVQEMADAGDRLKSIYDDLTGTTTYKTRDLEKAFKDLDAIRGRDSYATYLTKQIDAIQRVEDSLTERDISLLLSQDFDDALKQGEVIDRLRIETGLALSNGIKDALDYMESIELVSEALVNSRDNIKDFTDSFLTEQGLAENMAASLGVQLAHSGTELFSLFLKLKGSGGILTDVENDLLMANKALMESGADEYLESITEKLSSLEGVFDSLSTVIDKLRGSTVSSEYTLNQFYKSMSETLALSTTDDYEAFAESVQDTVSKSSVLSDASAFVTNRDMLFAQSVAANQFESMQEYTESQIDILKQIEENTRVNDDSLGFKITYDEFTNGFSASVQRTTEEIPFQVTPFANGGIVTSPTVGLIGEAGYNEAIIPLKDSNDPLGQTEVIAQLYLQNQLLNDIIMQLQDSKDIQNESLVKLSSLEEIA